MRMILYELCNYAIQLIQYQVHLCKMKPLTAFLSLSECLISKVPDFALNVAFTPCTLHLPLQYLQSSQQRISWRGQERAGQPQQPSLDRHHNHNITVNICMDF